MTPPETTTVHLTPASPREVEDVIANEQLEQVVARMFEPGGPGYIAVNVAVLKAVPPSVVAAISPIIAAAIPAALETAVNSAMASMHAAIANIYIRGRNYHATRNSPTSHLNSLQKEVNM